MFQAQESWQASGEGVLESWGCGLVDVGINQNAVRRRSSTVQEPKLQIEKLSKPKSRYYSGLWVL